MEMVTLTVTLPASIGESLADVARAEGRAPESVAVDAIAEHVAAALELRAKILRGEADVAAGRVVPHEEVMADLDRMIESAKRTRQR
jgi:predicted transcriptional regulator